MTDLPDRGDQLDLPAHDVSDISSAIAGRLSPGEDRADVLAAASLLALERARLAGRPADKDDVMFALAIFTWNPFKPPVPAFVEHDLLRYRRGLVQSAVFWPAGGDQVDRLMHAVPPETLRMTTQELYAAQQQGVTAFLRVDGLELAE